MRKKFQLTSLRAAGAALFGWRRQTPALLGRQSASRRCRAPGPTPREPGCKCRWEPQHAPPLRAAFPHFTSPSPAAGPRPSEKRSQALTRPPAAIPPGLPPSLRECPARRRPPPGSERQPRTYRRSRAAVRARRAALEPSSAELRPERPRRAALAARSGISSPPPARPGAERAGAAALPAPRLPPSLPSFPLSTAGPQPPLRVPRYLRVRTAAARPRRPGAPAARSVPLRCAARRSLPLRAACSAGGTAPRPRPPRLPPLPPSPSVSPFSSLPLSLSLPPPGRRGRCRHTPGSARSLRSPTGPGPGPFPPSGSGRSSTAAWGLTRELALLGANFSPVLGPKGAFYGFCLGLFSF